VAKEIRSVEDEWEEMDLLLNLYILNAVRCSYVRNAGRGQLSRQ